MSITSRINEMSSHIEQAYDELQGLGADLTNVNKNIENISMVLDDIYDSMPQVSGEGTSLTLDDTRVGKIKSTLKGNTSQDGTPTPTTPIPVNVVSGDNEIVVNGKNLINYVDNLRTSNAGLTSTINADGSITTTGKPTYNYANILSINITPYLQNGATYTLWQQNAESNLYLQLIGTHKTTSARTYQSLIDSRKRIFTVDTTNYTYMLTIQAGTTASWGDSSRTITNFYQFEKASDETAFEPYQGNNYNIDLPVENLYNGEVSATNQRLSTSTGGGYSVTGWSISSYVEVKPNTTYTISTKERIFCDEYDTSKAFIKGTAQAFGVTTPLTITTSNTTKYIRFDFPSGNESVSMVELGSKANSYTPYGTTPIELCKIGNYQDYIYKDSDKWYLHKEIGKVILNGGESWQVHGSIASWFYCDDVTDGYFNNARSDYALCNYFTQNSYSNVVDITNGQFVYGTPGGTTKRLVLKDTDYTTVADFKTWLSTHNVTLYYQLATPTNTEITYQPLIDQLNELEKAISYEGQTNISQVNNDLPFIISASALKEWSV